MKESKDSLLEVYKDNMIRWAKKHLGKKEYIGWCLAFIEDALEKSNNIEIFGGDSAYESYLMYSDSIKKDIPKKGSFVFYDCECKTSEGVFNYGHCGICIEEGIIIHALDEIRIDNYLDIEALKSNGKNLIYLGYVDLERVLKQKNNC